MGSDVIIIGAGMAGLSAGCYAQMNGYHSRIFELHAIPGGLCTAWKRKGYTFDASIHMLFSSSSGMFHRMWRELGIVQGRRFVHHELLMRIERMGKSIDVPSDLDRLERVLTELSPDDAPLIQELVGMARGMIGFNPGMDKPKALWTALDYVRLGRALVPVLGVLWHSRMSVQGYAARFKDPFLREVVRTLIEPPGWPMPDVPLTALLMVLAAAHTRNMGTPVGGSIAVAQTLAKRYRELGGRLHVSSPVDKILVERDHAVGVRLADRTEHRAGAVISAADGRTTIFKMLEGRYASPELRRAYAEWKVYPPLVQVMIGVARDLSEVPRHTVFDLPDPILVAGEVRRQLDVLHYSHDPSMAPAGKSVAQVWYPTNFDYWELVSRDPRRYEAEKKLVADLTLAELDRRWKGFAADVEVVDVPTPVTYQRYTGNFQGSPDGWCITTSNATSEMPKTLPGLHRFYMAGQWTIPFSGVPGAAATGCHAVQLLCAADRKKFQRMIPRTMEPVSSPQFHDVPTAAAAHPGSP